MRYLFALLIIIAGGLGGFAAYRHFTAGPPVVLPVPQKLAVTGVQGALLPGNWSSSPHVDLQVTESGVVAGVDVEVQPAGRAFTNTPTTTVSNPGETSAACAHCTTQGVATVPLHLADGSYHLQTRLHDKDGISPWLPFKGAINVDTEQPTVAALTSPTDPEPSTTYHQSTMRFTWQPTDRESGVAGSSYRLDTDPHGQAQPEVRTTGTSVTLTGMNTGTYYFHVRALDHAGNWGPTVTFPVHIDVTPPGLTHVRFSEFSIDPQFDQLHVSFGVTRPAPSVRIGIYRQSTGRPVRMYTLHDLTPGQNVDVAWDGKDGAGQLLPAGLYAVYIRAIDQYGHSTLKGWNDFALTYQRILVSLSQQRLWAYDGRNLFLSSLVTTGNKALPTPTGIFHILAKLHPFTFHSPWPKSSPYYYKPSKTQYAMLFDDRGYFIHDAPWRTAFGPGTNAQVGTPGTDYTGTHGCVNVPGNVAQALFGWVRIGTVVQIVP